MAPKVAAVKRKKTIRELEIAYSKIETEWLRLVKNHDLTPGEEAELLSKLLAISAKYQIRFERTGRYDKPAFNG